MIVDFAAHFHPERVFPEPMQGTEKVRRVGEKLRDPDALANFYEESGYDGAVLSQPFYMGHNDPEATAEANDALLETVQEYEQFWALAALPVDAGGSTAADEFARCLENGYHGGGLLTRTGDVGIDHESLDPVFDIAEAYDAPLMVHPKLENSLGRNVFDADDEKHCMNAMFGRETALCKSVIKAVQGGVFDDHPDLKLVYHHSAGNIAGMLGRVHLYQRPGWWDGQEQMWSNDTFRSVLESNVYMDTSGYIGYVPPFRAALEEFPTSHILLGTDCPFEARSVDDMTTFLRVTESLTSRTDSRKILGGNALDIMVNV